jgi:hypothetical protein
MNDKTLKAGPVSGGQPPVQLKPLAPGVCELIAPPDSGIPTGIIYLSGTTAYQSNFTGWNAAQPALPVLDPESRRILRSLADRAKTLKPFDSLEELAEDAGVHVRTVKDR